MDYSKQNPMFTVVDTFRQKSSHVNISTADGTHFPGGKKHDINVITGMMFVRRERQH